MFQTKEIVRFLSTYFLRLRLGSQECMNFGLYPKWRRYAKASDVVVWSSLIQLHPRGLCRVELPTKQFRIRSVPPLTVHVFYSCYIPWDGCLFVGHWWLLRACLFLFGAINIFELNWIYGCLGHWWSHEVWWRPLHLSYFLYQGII